MNVDSPIKTQMINDNCFVIAVDGTAASGKGSLSKKLADYYGYHYLDTGALYRRAALALMKVNCDIENVADIMNILRKVNFQEIFPQSILHSEEVGQVASEIASIAEIRQLLNKIQIEFPLGKHGVVVDGRDIGTVIFPNANVKLFVTASVEERARRRFKQFEALKPNLSYNQVLQDLINRDLRDKDRKISPTVASPDALIIDTTNLNEDEVFDLVKALLSNTRAAA